MTERSRFFIPYEIANSIELDDAGREVTPLELAQALASDPVGAGAADAAVVLRLNPQPIVALLGYFVPSAKTKMDVLPWQLDWSLSRLRYVDYQQAERDCTQLADALVAQFGWEELRHFHFTAIPRGGLIVLGLLSYILQLEYNRITVGAGVPATDLPLVVVDDCALTGARFGQFLRQFPERQVIFAHLYSHPDLRRAILERESRIIACQSAHDLQDYALQLLGSEYESWRARQLQRSGNRCYWVGLTDYICFSWNEPDFSLWNPVTQQEEAGWRVLPPELCLKNRPPPGVAPLPVQVQPEGNGPLRPSDAVLFGTLKEEVIVGSIESGLSYSLEGVAGDMWQGIVRHGNVADMVAELQQIYDVEETILQADADALVSQLLADRLLKYTSDGALD